MIAFSNRAKLFVDVKQEAVTKVWSSLKANEGAQRDPGIIFLGFAGVCL